MMTERRLTLAGLFLLVLSVLMTWHDPLMPAAGLDPSWVQATEFAIKSGRVFGRDYVFTYGPYQELATRLFDPATFLRVLFYDAFAVVAAFWVALRNRSLAAAIWIAVCIVMLQTASDALVAVALFGVFLVTLRERIWWSLAFVALCGPLLLSKLSFGLVLLPLLILADLYRLYLRRLPVMTVTLLAATLAAYLAAHQPLSALHDFITTSLGIILGYGAAMQWPGPWNELVGTILLGSLAAAVSLALALRAWRLARDAEEPSLAPLAAWLGFVWTLFVAFKMGFVRQDLHTLNYHQAAPAAFALMLGAIDRDGSRDRATRLVATALFVLLAGASIYWRSDITRVSPTDPIRPVAEAKRALGEIAPRLEQGLGWATGQRWSMMVQARTGADASIARPFPRIVSGSVDAIPWDAAPLIRSHLDYQPRPVVQSYSAYTPALQALDLDFFRHRAPDTLFLKVFDIDNRLPSLAAGPSLPVIGQQYDAVDSDPLGVILKRRATLRPMSVARTAPVRAAFNAWTSLPTGGGLVMAHIQMHPTLAGKLMGVAYRQPLTTITLRDTAGHETTYRFIPGMAELGVAISPEPASWEMSAPMLLDPRWARDVAQVSAIRLNARTWAFQPPTIWFETIRLEPGFASQLQGLPLIAGDLVASDAKHAATFNGQELFAHAATHMETSIGQPLHLRGIAGLHPQPPGTPPGDGVRFQITDVSGSTRRVLFDAVLKPGEAPKPFDIEAPAGTRLDLDTATLQTSDYDWSYWGQLQVVK